MVTKQVALALSFALLGASLAACSEQAVGNGDTLAGKPDPAPPGQGPSNPNNPPNTPPVIPPTLDTDGDGTPDAAEDRDGDGVVDPNETDPRTTDTDGDGTPDAAEVSYQACSRVNDRKVEVYDVPGADAMLMVDAVVSQKSWLSTSDGKVPGLQVFDPSTSVSAVVVGKRVSRGVASPSQQRDEERRTALAALGDVTTQQTRVFTTVEGFQAEQATFSVRLARAADAKTIASQLASGMLNGAALTGALTAGGPSAQDVVVTLLTVMRPQRVVLVAAVHAGASPSDPAAIRIEELTDGTNIARHGAFTRHVCDKLEAKAQSKADIIVVVDDSGSMEDDQQALRDAASAMGDVLGTAGVDFRLGVARMFSNDQNSRQRGDLVGDGLTDSVAEFQRRIVVGADGGWEPGLETGVLAYDRLLPKTAAGQPARADRLREDAAPVVVVLSDERDQAMECAACGSCNFDQGNDRQTFCSRAEGANVVSDFVRQYQTRNLTLFAIVGDLPNGCRQTNNRADHEPGQGYVEVANATGGQFGSLCGDMRQNLRDVARVTSGVASAYTLSAVPASASLKVAIGRPGAVRVIARSRVDGYDYDAVQNKIIFYGASRPADGDEVVIGYRRWDFADSPQTPADPCDECAANTSCAPTADVVQCEPLCGAVICAPGQACSIDSGTCGDPTQVPPTDACGGVCDAGQVCNPGTMMCQPPCEQTGCAAGRVCSAASHLCEIPSF